MIRLALTLTLTVSAVGVSAHAQQADANQAIAFLDSNGDSKISPEEYALFQTGRIGQFDADQSGALSADEFVASLSAAERPGAAVALSTFDSNGDQALGRDELAAYHAHILRTFIDADKDGYMSVAELEASRQGQSQTVSAPAAVASPQLAMLDYNKDGKTDLNEYLNFQLPNLAKNDANGNGRLSKDEFKSSLSAVAQKNASRSFEAFDRDKDNGLEQQEFLGYHAFVFNNVLDRNKDDVVDPAEWARLAAEGRN